MVLIDKAYFSLEEIEERWHMPHRDLAYLAENGLLRLSIRLFGVHIERGEYEEDAKGDWFSVPMERTCFTGFQDLQERDVFRLFRDGEILAESFAVCEREYCHVLEPSTAVAVRLEDLLIRREERDRVEAKHSQLLKGVSSSPPALNHCNEFREITVDGHVFHLGPLQAKLVKRLHEVAYSANPWLDGKLILGEAGSGSTRMADVFKSQPRWRDLIESDKRGRYRLRLARGG
jgi:hypothetical protein